MDFSLAALDAWLRPITGWVDILDVLLVALVLYNLLLLIRGTRAVQIVIGILVLVTLYYIARVLDLPALETTLENFFKVLPVAIIVLFQHEIRRALANFGRTPILRFATYRKVGDSYEEIVVAATTLSERRIGALIVIERSQGLRNYIENGIQLDALVSLDLLISLFTPETPTHDGAVIVQGNRLAAATCFLPLTRRSQVSKAFGTRHRAALGISEETDALAIAVSEETGKISVALNGELTSGLEPKDLRAMLFRSLVTEPQQVVEDEGPDSQDRDRPKDSPRPKDRGRPKDSDGGETSPGQMTGASA